MYRFQLSIVLVNDEFGWLNMWHCHSFFICFLILFSCYKISNVYDSLSLLCHWLCMHYLRCRQLEKNVFLTSIWFYWNCVVVFSYKEYCSVCVCLVRICQYLVLTDLKKKKDEHNEYRTSAYSGDTPVTFPIQNWRVGLIFYKSTFQTKQKVTLCQACARKLWWLKYKSHYHALIIWHILIPKLLHFSCPVERVMYPKVTLF